MKTINTTILKQQIPDLRAGDRIALSGTVYTARDAAHKRLFELLNSGRPLPIELKGVTIYYASPTPAPSDKPNIAVGACGPTTSSRMDPFAPRLLDLGLLCMIGKGERSPAVTEAIVRNGAIYLCAIGGAGALISKHIKKSEEIAFSDLGCESIKRMEIQEMPLTVAIDSRGDNIFETGRAAFSKVQAG